GIRDFHVTGVQTCALPISYLSVAQHGRISRNIKSWPIVIADITIRFATHSHFKQDFTKRVNFIRIYTVFKHRLKTWVECVLVAVLHDIETLIPCDLVVLQIIWSTFHDPRNPSQGISTTVKR